jgi:F0F1-type ATP synthase assembly protein I
MTGLWLDRAGKILTFLAAFMLAPDLIGLERIELWRKRSEVKVFRAHNKSRASLDDMAESPTARGPILEIVVALIINVLLGVVVSAVWYFSIYKSWWFMIVTVGLLAATLVVVSLLAGYDHAYLFLLLLPVAAPFSAFLAILIAPSRLLPYLMLTLLLKGLEGEGRLRTLLIPLGILTFTIGSLLELIATFL